MPLWSIIASVVAVAAPVSGYGVSASAPDARHVPDAWSEGAPSVLWRVPTKGWSNATPLVVGDLVCVLQEPITLTCHDAATGAVRWSVDTQVGDVLEGAAKAAWFQARDEAEARAEAALALQRAYSQTRRRLRAEPDNAALRAQMEALGKELPAIREQVQRERHRYFTPEDQEVVGYTSASPTSDGERIFVLLGTGALAAYDLEGTRLWGRDLGPPRDDMRGYHLGTSASLVAFDHHLIVPFGTLRSVDPATGQDRWTAMPYRDFGTPAVGRVHGVGVVITPDGHLLRLDDGAVLQAGLPDTWFVGPLLDGDITLSVGARTTHGQHGGQQAFAEAWRLSAVDDRTLTATKLWHTPLADNRRYYAPPIATPEAFFAAHDGAALVRFDRATGEATMLPESRLGPGYPTPVRVSQGILVTGEMGQAEVRQTQPPFDIVASGRTERTRATPVVVGRHTYVRSLTHLWKLEAAP